MRVPAQLTLNSQSVAMTHSAAAQCEETRVWAAAVRGDPWRCPTLAGPRVLAQDIERETPGREERHGGFILTTANQKTHKHLCLGGGIFFKGLRVFCRLSANCCFQSTFPCHKYRCHNHISQSGIFKVRRISAFFSFIASPQALDSH